MLEQEQLIEKSLAAVLPTKNKTTALAGASARRRQRSSVLNDHTRCLSFATRGDELLATTSAQLFAATTAVPRLYARSDFFLGAQAIARRWDEEIDGAAGVGAVHERIAAAAAAKGVALKR